MVALDKTGTLTTGELRVERVESFPPGREQEIASLHAHWRSSLPIHWLARLSGMESSSRFRRWSSSIFESITGQGLQGRRGTDVYQLGKRAWIFKPEDPAIARIPATEAGVSEVWVAAPGLIGRLLLRDDIRPQAQLCSNACGRMA